MKLAPVLTKYLTANKKLSLPGLGVFHADNAYDPNVDYGKKENAIINVSFEQTKVIALDEDLINFVSAETGKMKVLSESDLKSELEGVTDFLNTGKPYFISGIGTLTQKADKTLEFYRDKHPDAERRKTTSITEKNVMPQSYIDETRKYRRTKPALIILTLCILAIATTIWFYVKNTKNNNEKIEDVTVESEVESKPIEDTSKAITETANNNVAAAAAPNSYKYILEVAQQTRAFKRYNQLKNINWPVEMETTDSLSYTLFIKLPAANSDTARVKDSLSVLSGRKVWIGR